MPIYSLCIRCRQKGWNIKLKPMDMSAHTAGNSVYFNNFELLRCFEADLSIWGWMRCSLGIYQYALGAQEFHVQNLYSKLSHHLVGQRNALGLPRIIKRFKCAHWRQRFVTTGTYASWHVSICIKFSWSYVWHGAHHAHTSIANPKRLASFQ